MAQQPAPPSPRVRRGRPALHRYTDLGSVTLGRTCTSATGTARTAPRRWTRRPTA
ncbi:hypothetical protein ACR6C2_29840 [Streptomyces sp. INA 01156]